MGERSSYPQGTFCWAELATGDQPAAKAFYAALFGWQADDRPVGEGVTYSMQTLDGQNVAAIAVQPKAQRDAGLPPLWNSYVSVEDSDAVARRASELGADVHAGPFDVFDSGRMAVIQDPQGAFFMIWQAGEHHGAGLVNVPGALIWNELSTPDIEASVDFYGGLFGWSTEPVEDSPDPYLTILNGENQNGGIRQLAERMPPNWLVYFATADIAATCTRLAELGGATMVGPIELHGAKIAVVHDPQGAVFALYEGELDP